VFLARDIIFLYDSLDLRLDDAGMYECVASSRSGKYAWKSFLTVVPVLNIPLGLQPNGRGRHRMAYLGGNGDMDRPSPMKPHIVKIESTSVTLAWHPKYFNKDILTLPQKQSSSFLNHLKAFPEVDDEITMSDQPDDIEFGGKLKRAISSGEESSALPPLSHKEKVEEDLEEEEEENEEFEKTLENLTAIEEEDEESDQNGNNLIIQSTRPTNDTNAIITTSTNRISSLGSSTDPPTTLSSVSGPLSTLFLRSPMRTNQISFNVEYYSAQELRSEWLLGANVPTETVTLQYLKPNAEYVFFVRSVSGDGIVSPPSPLSDPVLTFSRNNKNDVEKARAQLEAGIVVLLKAAYATSSSSVKIEWQASRLIFTSCKTRTNSLTWQHCQINHNLRGEFEIPKDARLFGTLRPEGVFL